MSVRTMSVRTMSVCTVSIMYHVARTTVVLQACTPPGTNRPDTDRTRTQTLTVPVHRH